jgi:putative lipoic acid-binding regulatory protein
MLKNEPNAEKEVEKVVSEYANIVADGTSSRVSKKMTYVSVSCTAHLQNESQLKNIYQALKEHSMVIMTL